LLTHLTISDIENLQAVGKEAQASRSKFILRDDQDLAWNRVKQLKGARIDFILDNGSPLFLSNFVKHTYGHCRLM
jgi:hypothetical protein